MNNTQVDPLIHEIQELNLNALVLAQSLVKSDKARAQLHFGLSSSACDLLEGLSVRQIQMLAKVPYLLFPLKLDHKVIGDIFSNHQEDEVKTLLHLTLANMANRKD